MKTTRQLLSILCVSTAMLVTQACGPKGDPAPESKSPEPPAQKAAAAGTNVAAATSPSAATNAPTSTNAVAVTNATPPNVAASTNRPPTPPPNAVAMVAPTPPTASASATSTNAPEAEREIQVSFRGSNIDMVIQWLAKETGKSVVKHPQARVQLTIFSSKKLPVREAIELVYQAMALEGYHVIETSNAIMIVPSGKEPKMSPEFVGEKTTTEIGLGRRQIVRIFEIQHGQASEFSDRAKAVLSEKASVEIDSRGNKLIVTDYTENIKVLEELLPMIDVETDNDQAIEIYPLKHLDADELSGLLGMILQQEGGSSSSSSSRSSSSSSSSRYSSSSSRSRSSSSRSSSSPPTTVSAPGVKIWPDRSANRLVVAAPKSKQEEIKDLIDLLDTEKPVDVGVRVLPLKHIDAEDLVDEIAPLYRKMGGQSLKEAVEITANERSNALIILSSQSNFENIKEFIDRLDTEDAQQQVMETIPLDNADAEDVAQQLKELSENQSNSSSRYSYYSYRYGSSSNDDEKMSIVADRRRNSVIVMASPAQILSLKQMIQVLDEPLTDDALAPKIRQLKFVSAVDIEEVLNELFIKKTQRRSYWDYYDDGGTQDGPQNVGRLNGKVRITSEPYSNSIIIAANSQEALEAVEQILDQLDVQSTAGESTLRIQLNFADSIEVANNLNILFAQDGSPALSRVNNQPNQQNQSAQRNNQQNPINQPSGFELERERERPAYFPWIGGQQGGRGRDGREERPASELVGRVRAVPDKRSNSILLTSDVHYLPQVLKLINELDAPTAQVLIDAKIIEVSNDFRDKLGTRWAVDGTEAFSQDDRDGAVQPRLGANFMNVLVGNFATNAFRSGVIDSSINVDVLVQFLRRNTDATVLAEPKISVSDNELGKLFVGAQVPFINTSINTPQGGRNDSFQYKDVGVILEVTPSINNSEEIALRIRAESSNIRNGQTLFGGAILDTRNFRTDLIVKSGQTVVLGGIIQKEEGEVIRKTPFLGDIPGLGWAFKKKDKTMRNVELLVLLRPVIARSGAEAEALLQDVENRMPSLKSWRKENNELQLKLLEEVDSEKPAKDK